MTVICETLDSLLLEGDPFSMDVAAQHARSCAACRAKLASWNEISETARGLHTEWSSDTLWPRNDRALRRETNRPRTRFWQIAAAIALLAGMGIMVRVAQQRTHDAEFHNVILRASALDEVEKAEKDHQAAIARMEQLAGAKLDEPATPLLASYKEKLMLLDVAIAECQANIDRNQRNAYLRKQLLAMYSEKQRTLQDVLREKETHETNQ